MQTLRALVLLFLMPLAQPVRLLAAWVTNGDKTLLLQQQQPWGTFQYVKFRDLPKPAIQLDDSSTYQSMVGFGAHMTESSAYNLMQLGSPSRTEALTALFGATGARFSVVALTIGASDFSLSSFTYADQKGPDDNLLLNFSIDKDRNYVIPMLKEVKAIRPDLTIMARPWSPPAWMKDSNSLNGGALLPQYFSTYVDYLVAYVEAFKAEGLQIDYLSLINEPQYNTTSYPSTLMSAANQIQILKLTRAALDNCVGCGNVRLVAYEHNWDTTAYPLAVLGDAGANAAVVGTAWHCYGGGVSAQSTVHSLYPNKDIFFTECTGGGWAPSFKANLSWNMRNVLIGGVANWARTALLFNLALNDAGGPTNGGCNNCRGVITVKADGTIVKNSEFYGLAHMQKFLQPGAVRIKSSGPLLYGNPSTGEYLHNAAFKNPDGSIVVVVLNEGWNTAYDVRIYYKNNLLTWPKLAPESVATFVIQP